MYVDEQKRKPKLPPGTEHFTKQPYFCVSVLLFRCWIPVRQFLVYTEEGVREGGRRVRKMLYCSGCRITSRPTLSRGQMPWSEVVSGIIDVDFYLVNGRIRLIVQSRKSTLKPDSQVLTTFDNRHARTIQSILTRFHQNRPKY